MAHRRSIHPAIDPLFLSLLIALPLAGLVRWMSPTAGVAAPNLAQWLLAGALFGGAGILAIFVVRSGLLEIGVLASGVLFIPAAAAAVVLLARAYRQTASGSSTSSSWWYCAL